MHFSHINKVEKEGIPLDGAKGSGIQWLLTNKEGAEKFHMRLITIEPGGNIPVHQHDNIHETFVVKGQGAMVSETGEKTAMAEGNFAFVPGNLKHGFINTGETDFQFICCIDNLDTPNSYK